jgi:hypothetical protein
MLDNAQKQYLREALVEYLAKRVGYSFNVSTLTRAVVKNGLVDFPISEADLAEALAVTTGLGFTAEIMPKLGSIREYHITPDGTLFYERQR